MRTEYKRTLFRDGCDDIVLTEGRSRVPNFPWSPNAPSTKVGIMYMLGARRVRGCSIPRAMSLQAAQLVQPGGQNVIPVWLVMFFWLGALRNPEGSRYLLDVLNHNRCALQAPTVRKQ